MCLPCMTHAFTPHNNTMSSQDEEIEARSAEVTSPKSHKVSGRTQLKPSRPSSRACTSNYGTTPSL